MKKTILTAVLLFASTSFAATKAEPDSRTVDFTEIYTLGKRQNNKAELSETITKHSINLTIPSGDEIIIKLPEDMISSSFYSGEFPVDIRKRSKSDTIDNEPTGATLSISQGKAFGRCKKLNVENLNTQTISKCRFVFKNSQGQIGEIIRIENTVGNVSRSFELRNPNLAIGESIDDALRLVLSNGINALVGSTAVERTTKKGIKKEMKFSNILWKKQTDPKAPFGDHGSAAPFTPSVGEK